MQKHRMLAVLLLVALAIAASACGAPATPTLKPTVPPPTPVPLPTLTPTPVPPTPTTAPTALPTATPTPAKPSPTPLPPTKMPVPVTPKPTATATVPRPPAQRFHASVTHIGGNYAMTNGNFLREGADWIEQQGADAIFVWMGPTFRIDYPDGATPEWPKVNPKSLTELAQTKPYQNLFARPFQMYVIQTYTFASGDDVFPPGFSAKAEEKEMFNFASYLFETYQGTGKVFVLKNWETDWFAIDDPDSKDISKEAVNGMVAWFTARQTGVTRARQAAQKRGIVGVEVYHAVEVNKVVDIPETHRLRIINTVVPAVRADMVTYSSWESTFDGAPDAESTRNHLLKALGVIDDYAPDPLGLGRKRILLSEYGVYEKLSDPDSPAWRTDVILETAKDYGLSGAFFWQLYDNECNGVNGKPIELSALRRGNPDRPSNEQCPGLWLIRPDGTEATALSVLRKHWAIHVRKAPLESPSLPKSLPPQGLYDSCEPSTGKCRSHLDKFAKAGFKLVMNYGVFDYDVADILSYADHANAVGMKVIWDVRAGDYRDGTFDRDYIRERVEAVKTRPVTWGYYIADEPGSATPNDIGSEREPVKALSDYVHQLDPAHPRFLVHWAEYYPNDPVINLRLYVDSADVIAVDIYPTAACGPAEDVEAPAKASQELADEKGKQWAIVLQSFDGAQYKKEIPDACPGWPDRERMLKERNLVLKNSHAAFILWYSYFDILRSSDPAGHWADLVNAAFSPEPPVKPTSISNFFPIGLYCVDALPYSNKVTEEFPDIAAAGFNLVQSYQFENPSALDTPANTNENARAYLDAADKSGLKVLMGIPEECVSKRNLACIRSRVSALKDHPALYGWQLYDEPELYIKTPDPVGDLTSAYQQIKQLDPRHPVTIAAADPVDANYRYREGADIVMTQLLVIPTDVWYGETPLGEVMRDIVGPAVTLLTQEGKSTLPHVQAYNLGTGPLMKVPKSQGRYPTREEMRFEAYYSIILGGKGLFFNCYRYNYSGEEFPLDDISCKANPKQWQAVSSVASELRSLSPILSTATVEHAGITVTGGQAAIMLKKYQDRYYLFVTNPSSNAGEFEVRLDPARFPNLRIMLYPEKRNIPATGNSFTDQWGPYDVRIYVISTNMVYLPVIMR